jgi:hypothetical protein
MMQMTEEEPEHVEEVVGSVPCKHTHVPLWPPSSSSAAAAAANQDDVDDDDDAILGFQ